MSQTPEQPEPPKPSKHVLNKEEHWQKVVQGEVLPSDTPEDQEAHQVRQILLWRDARQQHGDEVKPQQAQLIRQQAEFIYQRQKKNTNWRMLGLLVAVILLASILGAGVTYWLLNERQATNYSPQRLSTSTSKTILPEKPADSAFDTPMAPIPAGEFNMGCVTNWDDVLGGCRENEYPPRQVKVKAFHIARHEVTVNQFQQFVEASHYKTLAESTGVGCVIRDPNSKNPMAPNWISSSTHHWRNPGFEQTPDHPVTCISWQDAQAFIQWLNTETGKQYRLPTEAEWEYAARGGKSTAFSWGNKPSYNHANFIGIANNDAWDFTAPVGNLVRNEYGLSDMAGNVWEWVQDCWHDNYLNAPNTAIEWSQNCKDPNKRVRRGGGWDNLPISIRPAYRSPGNVIDRSYLYGFRLAHD